MRTTIDLPDELFRQLKAKAALSGIKMKDLITSYVEQGLKSPPPETAPHRRRRSELPVARAATGRSLPSLTNVDIQRILDEVLRAEARREEVAALATMCGMDLPDEDVMSGVWNGVLVYQFPKG